MRDALQTSAPTPPLIELRRGWRVLLGSMIGLAMGAPILPYIAGIFIPPLQHEFGWTRSELAAASLIIVLVLLPLTPAAGLLVDRWGVRKCVALGMGSMALGFAGFALMSGNFSQYILIYIAMGALALLSTPISFTRALNERFDSARGLALGIALSGIGIAATFAPSIVSAVIVHDGWRSAYFKLAAAVLFVIPLVMLLLGGDRRRAPVDPAIVEPVARLPLRAIIETSPFPRLAAIFLMLGLGVQGMVLHLVPMLTDQGWTPTAAAAMQGRLGLSIIAGRLIFGAAVDRFFAPRISALLLCATIAGLVALAASGPASAGWAVVGIGLAVGAEGELIGYLTARYFGMAHYGQRYGMLYTVYLLANGLSPLAISLVAENLGGYRPALWGCAGFVLIAVLLLFTAPRFPEHAVSA